jgi:hypothetical protein
MASLEDDTIKGMLQTLEHVLDSVDRANAAAVVLLNAQKTGKPLSAGILTHYERQLQELAREREQMREVIARWWTLFEDRH